MTKRLPPTIARDGLPFRLRLAAAEDRELLRVWKNAHRQFFFHSDEITPAQQERWFDAYDARVDDHVYMVEEREAGAWIPVGVVACRALPDEKTVDVYNIMRGRRTPADLTNMGEALLLLCAEIEKWYEDPITCKVLSANPALAWYARLGFRLQEDRGSYRLLRKEAV